MTLSSKFSGSPSTRVGLVVAWLALMSVPDPAMSGNDPLDAFVALESEHSALCEALLPESVARERIAALAAAYRSSIAGAGASAPASQPLPAELEVATLNRIVFAELGLQASKDTADPCNLFLSSVLARKRGYCLGIAALYLSLSDALGLPVRAVATPSHVFLRYDDGRARINIETFDGGAAISDEAYAQRERMSAESLRRGVFMRSLSLRQFLAQMHNNLGVIYSERREFEKAEASYARALRLDRRLPAAWYNQGRAQVEQRRHAEAVKSFTRALRLNAADAWSLNNRGRAYEELGKLDRARADFRAALEIDPAYEAARRSLERLTGR